MKIYYLVGILLLLIGCSSSTSHTQRVDSKSIHLTTIHWGSEELQEMAQAMVVSILSSDISQVSSPKVLSFLKIKNNSYDHINTQSLTEMITVGLIKSKRVLIVDKNKRETLQKALWYQKNKEKYFKQIQKIGRQVGIDGLFTGEISAIYQKNSATKDMYFRFTLNLVDIQTAEIIWSEEVEIRKIRKKAFIQW